MASPRSASVLPRIDAPASGGGRLGASVWAGLRDLDPRITIAVILFSYLVLGFTVLGFNRTPTQAAITTLSACVFEVVLARLFKSKWIFPLSAMITSFSLSILLNYSHDYFILAVPVFFAIGSKYLFTFEGRHFFNPALAGLVFCLFFSEGLITASPAYQWNGIESMSAFMAMLAVFFLLPKVKRHYLVISFLVSFTVLTALRAWVMRWHLPFETLFLGTLSSPAFFLFTFFMITDPATSPGKPKAQIILGAVLALVDLSFHIWQSYYTFFYAAFLIQATRLVWSHATALAASDAPLNLLRQKALTSGWYQRALFLGGTAAIAVLTYRTTIEPRLEVNDLDWSLVQVPVEHSGIEGQLGRVLERTDPRIHHIAKWLLSVGDAVAVGDFDGDGLQDLFFTQPLKADEDRNALYRNLGDFRFERVPLPAIADKTRDVESHGLSTAALFVDDDNDGDQDLFIAYASGRHVLLENQLSESGSATFVDASRQRGIDAWSNAMAANFLDINGDGRLDILIGNVLPEQLPNYDHPAPLNLFDLPQPEYEGDERMFDFMHSSWHMSNNGGENLLYLGRPEGGYELQDATRWGLPETRWTLAIGTADFDHDGDTDVYVANDFGPDDFYLNDGDKGLRPIRGEVFGSIGRDTYKGMNASVADVDNNGWLDVYVSNVHHALQAEGSLLWMFDEPTHQAPDRPSIEDRATELGALNEQRFGWGATLTDFDNDGWIDIAQANGMVDDTIDPRFETCPDYWYVNEKIARSPPSIHRFANKWGDIRGFCIYGKEKNRLYLNRGSADGRRFVDVADQIGLTAKTNSRGMASVDLDNDGRRDLIITHQFGPPTILKNTVQAAPPTSAAHHWIGLRLAGDGVQCNRDALGSTVRLSYRAPDGLRRERIHEIQAATGFSAQEDRRVHFGLGGHDGSVDVEITWCGKQTTTLTDVPIDQYHFIPMSDRVARR